MQVGDEQEPAPDIDIAVQRLNRQGAGDRAQGIGLDLRDRERAARKRDGKAVGGEGERERGLDVRLEPAQDVQIPRTGDGDLEYVIDVGERRDPVEAVDRRCNRVGRVLRRDLHQEQDIERDAILIACRRAEQRAQIRVHLYSDRKAVAEGGRTDDEKLAGCVEEDVRVDPEHLRCALIDRRPGLDDHGCAAEIRPAVNAVSELRDHLTSQLRLPLRRGQAVGCAEARLPKLKSVACLGRIGDGDCRELRVELDAAAEVAQEEPGIAERDRHAGLDVDLKRSVLGQPDTDIESGHAAEAESRLDAAVEDVGDRTRARCGGADEIAEPVDQGSVRVEPYHADDQRAVHRSAEQIALHSQRGRPDRYDRELPGTDKRWIDNHVRYRATNGQRDALEAVQAHGRRELDHKVRRIGIEVRPHQGDGSRLQREPGRPVESAGGVTVAILAQADGHPESALCQEAAVSFDREVVCAAGNAHRTDIERRGEGAEGDEILGRAGRRIKQNTGLRAARLSRRQRQVGTEHDGEGLRGQRKAVGAHRGRRRQVREIESDRDVETAAHPGHAGMNRTGGSSDRGRRRRYRDGG